MAHPGRERSVAARPVLVSSVMFVLTLLLIYILILYPRPFLFSRSEDETTTATSVIGALEPTTDISEIAVGVEENEDGIEDDETLYPLLNETFSRQQIPLYNLPYMYKVRLRVHLPFRKSVDFGADNYLVLGSCSIFFTVQRTNTRVQVHSVGHHISSLYLQDDFGRNISTQYNHDFPHVLDVHTEHELLPNMNYSLHISYTTRISEKRNLVGFYKAHYQINGEERYVAATHLQPQHARELLPCFDLPEAKATFRMTVIHPSGTVALSNSMVRTSKTEGNWTTTIFDPSPYMSTYLIAITISDFLFKQAVYKERVRLRVYASPDRIDDVDFALGLLPRFIEFYEDYFEIPIPLKKLDVFPTPQMKTMAMENWGLITVAPKFLYFRKNETMCDERAMIVQVLTHEIAHQWFGNLVTMRWWNNLWLNEGFASLMAHKFVEEYEGADIEYHKNICKMLRKEQTVSQQSVSRVENELIDPSANFHAIVYTKPIWIMETVENVVGVENFRQGLQRFLRRYSYSTADSDDLMEALTYAHDSSSGSHLTGQTFSLIDVIRTWIYQEGYPLLVVNSREPGVQIVSQQAYWHIPEQRKDLQWKIPIILRNPISKQQTITWLVENSTVAVDMGEDIIMDRNATTYVRILYDEKLYTPIIEQLFRDYSVIPVGSRARLVDDSLTFAEHGLISYGIALNLSFYLRNELENPPILRLHFHIDFLNSRLNVPGSMEAWQQYMIAVYEPAFERYESMPIKDNPGELEARQVVYRRFCLTGRPQCIELARRYVANAKDSCDVGMLSSSCNRIPKFLRDSIYSTVSMYGEPQFFEFLYQKFLIESDPDERQSLWLGMAASKRKEHIYRSFDAILLDPKREDGVILPYCQWYTRFYHNPNHFLAYFEEKVDEILKKVSLHEAVTLMSTLTRSATELDDIPLLKRCLKKVKERFPRCPGVPVDRVSTLVQWRIQYSAAIVRNITLILQQLRV